MGGPPKPRKTTEPAGGKEQGVHFDREELKSEESANLMSSSGKADSKEVREAPLDASRVKYHHSSSSGDSHESVHSTSATSSQGKLGETIQSSSSIDTDSALADASTDSSAAALSPRSPTLSTPTLRRGDPPSPRGAYTTQPAVKKRMPKKLQISSATGKDVPPPKVVSARSAPDTSTPSEEEAYEDRSSWLERVQMECPMVKEIRERVRPMARTLTFARHFSVEPKFPAEDVLTGAIPPVKRSQNEIVIGLIMQHLHAAGMHKTVAAIHQELDRLALRPIEPSDALIQSMSPRAYEQHPTSNLKGRTDRAASDPNATTPSTSPPRLHPHLPPHQAFQASSLPQPVTSPLHGHQQGHGETSSSSYSSTNPIASSVLSSTQTGSSNYTTSAYANASQSRREKTLADFQRQASFPGGRTSTRDFINTSFYKDQAFFERERRESPLLTVLRSAVARTQDVYDLAVADRPGATNLSEAVVEERLYNLGMLEDELDTVDDIDIWAEGPDPEEDLNAPRFYSYGGPGSSSVPGTPTTARARHGRADSVSSYNSNSGTMNSPSTSSAAAAKASIASASGQTVGNSSAGSGTSNPSIPTPTSTLVHPTTPNSARTPSPASLIKRISGRSHSVSSTTNADGLPTAASMPSTSSSPTMPVPTEPIHGLLSPHTSTAPDGTTTTKAGKRKSVGFASMGTSTHSARDSSPSSASPTPSGNSAGGSDTSEGGSPDPSKFSSSIPSSASTTPSLSTSKDTSLPESATNPISYAQAQAAAQAKAQRAVDEQAKGRKLIYDMYVEVEDDEERPIRAATLNKLVEVATSSKLSDLNFLPTFLLTYKSFTTPKRLLEKLKQRFNVPTSLAADRGIPMEQWKDMIAMPIRLRVVSFLKRWIQDYPEDIDRPLLSEMRKFVEKMIQTDPGLRLVANSIGTFLERRAALLAAQSVSSSSCYRDVSVIGGHGFSFQGLTHGQSPYATATALVFSQSQLQHAHPHFISAAGSSGISPSLLGSITPGSSTGSLSGVSPLTPTNGGSSSSIVSTPGGSLSSASGSVTVPSLLGGAGQLASSSVLIAAYQSVKKASVAPGVPPVPKVPKTIFHPTLTLYQIDQEEFARQLTILDSHVFVSIKPSELLNQSWNKPKLKHLAPNVLRMVNMFNQLSHSVSTLILAGQKPRERAKIIEWWIKVAEHCKAMNNFHGMMAVVSGINSGPTVRLKASRREISKTLMDQLSSFESIFESEGSFSAYRSTLYSAEPPLIPYLGIHLTDLTFIEEGNKDMQAHLINFAKRRLLYQTISGLQNFQQTIYNFQPVRQIQDIIANLKPAESKDLFKLSLAREPRERS